MKSNSMVQWILWWNLFNQLTRSERKEPSSAKEKLIRTKDRPKIRTSLIIVLIWNAIMKGAPWFLSQSMRRNVFKRYQKIFFFLSHWYGLALIQNIPINNTGKELTYSLMTFFLLLDLDMVLRFLVLEISSKKIQWKCSFFYFIPC